jgi:ABC-type hemin transport system substrate-binding protein
MCTHASPNIVLFQIKEVQFRIPVCHVVCCDMEKKEIEDWIDIVTNPIQTAFKAKQLELNVKDLTTQLTKLTKAIEKPQLKRG